MNTFEAIAVLLLQRVPLINRIPAIANAGTVEAAVAGLGKAVAKLEDVGALHRQQAAGHNAVADVAREAAKVATNAAERAERVAKNIGDLLK